MSFWGNGRLILSLLKDGIESLNMFYGIRVVHFLSFVTGRIHDVNIFIYFIYWNAVQRKNGDHFYVQIREFGPSNQKS